MLKKFAGWYSLQLFCFKIKLKYPKKRKFVYGNINCTS
jgi:hypothetical protein